MGTWITCATGGASRWANAFAGVCLIVMTTIMGFEVCMRYIYNMPTIWVFETTHYLEIGVMTWGLAYALSKGAHIKVSAVIERLPRRVRGWTDAVASLLVLGTLSAVLWALIRMVMRTLERHEISDTLLGVPLHWPQIAAIIGFLLITLQAAIICWNNWQRQLFQHGGDAQ